MRVQLTMVLVIVLLIGPAISQYTQVGGSYGMNWLNQTGSLRPASQAAGLWSWGNIPKGETLSNGKLSETNGGLLIYPAFPASANEAPIVLNATTPGREIGGNNSSQISNPYLLEDPWTVAQTTNRPVLFGVNPY